MLSMLYSPQCDTTAYSKLAIVADYGVETGRWDTGGGRISICAGPGITSRFTEAILLFGSTWITAAKGLTIFGSR